MSAPFTVTDDKLTLDVSKSWKRFCSRFSSEYFPIAQAGGLELEWGKLEWTKVKKE